MALPTAPILSELVPQGDADGQEPMLTNDDGPITITIKQEAMQPAAAAALTALQRLAALGEDDSEVYDIATLTEQEAEDDDDDDGDEPFSSDSDEDLEDPELDIHREDRRYIGVLEARIRCISRRLDEAQHEVTVLRRKLQAKSARRIDDQDEE